MTGRRVGILGGTFDPPHEGHVAIARAALAAGLVDEVLVVPAGDPWQKAGVTAAAHRLAMTRLAFADQPHVQVSDIEVTRDGPTYAIDTVRAVRAGAASHVSYLLGADALMNLPTWHDIDILVTLCDFVVVQRPGSPLHLPAIAGLQVHTLAMPSLDVSSTQLRAGARAALPPTVLEYIRTHGLYGGVHA